jgi:hypothetical protein
MDETPSRQHTAFKNAAVFVGGMVAWGYFDAMRSRNIPDRWQGYAGGVAFASAAMLGGWAQHVREHSAHPAQQQLG